jgi:predicted nucleic acid-binding protein
LNVVDASVIVALFKTDEPSHDMVRSWYASALATGVVAPSILLAEVSGALARPTGDSEAARSAVDALRRTARLQVIAVTEELSVAAAEVARDHRMRGCDSIYVALAIERRLPLITLDEDQLLGGGVVTDVRRPGLSADA